MNAPNYYQLVLEMMMTFPTLFPSELHCQVNLFLTHGDVYVKDGEIVDGRSWKMGEKGTPIDRTLISVLGDKEENHKKINSTERADSPMFYPISSSNFFTAPSEWRRKTQEGYFSQDIFNSILNKKIVLNEVWKWEVHMFCSEILRWHELEYKALRFAYCRRNCGNTWERRLYEDVQAFRRLQTACKQVSKILFPPQSKKKGPPPIDWDKIHRDHAVAVENELKKKLGKI